MHHIHFAIHEAEDYLPSHAHTKTLTEDLNGIMAGISGAEMSANS